MIRPMTTNASFIFYRDSSYGKDLNDKLVKELLGLNSDSLSSNTLINGISYEEYFKADGALAFKLKTVYPGMIIGAGYNHPASGQIEGKDAEESSDFQLGFYFDHTTGMPVIPSSTVKGKIKSVFPKEHGKDHINAEKIKYLNGLLGRDGVLNIDNWESLFETGNIFYDAYVSAIPKGGKIFAEDFITPHAGDIFKDPKPIRFLKIAPSVTFTFQFSLKDSQIGDQLVTAAEKLSLFKKILLDIGIGAKGNVGYGNLVDNSDQANASEQKKPNHERTGQESTGEVDLIALASHFQDKRVR